MPDGLLLITAHPDDESFFGAGTAARYADQGVRVALACATLGQAGKTGDPPVASREELPAARERELRQACDILGIHLVALLGYVDKHLADAPVERVREQLVRVIRAEQPLVVATFDPNGVNLHPDHVAISRFTTDAIAAASDPRWFPDSGAPHRVPRLVWPAPPFLWDEWRPERLVTEPGVDFLLDNAAWRDRKVRALRAHRSQHLSIEPLWFDRPHSAEILSIEAFRQGLGPELSERPATDLFAGLRAPG